MGLTFVKRFENRSRSTVILLNKETSNTRGHNIAVPPGSSIAADMAIPWAPAQADFPAHHLEIVVGGVIRYWIWQGKLTAFKPGRHVRYDDDPSVGALYTTILQAFGLPDTGFGDATEALDGLD